MSYHRNILLAGIAALALAAGMGLAAAEEPSTGQSPQNRQPHATQQMNQAPAAGKMGQNAQDENHGAAARQPKERADEVNRASKTDKGRNAAEGERNGKAAQEQNQEQNRNGRDSNTAAQRERNGTQGLQGNASGMHAQLTDEQRTRIRGTVINAAGAPRVGHVNFDVTVGTVIPRDGIHIVPVPEMLVQIEPEWRGFLYFVYEDEVVIVNPSDMRIIAVVPA
jgi:hypothetical protein